ncbi:type III PLP-dependent enzyme domain-containing protein [Nocardia goodfellowii]|uniref:Diaminopimelate decarboxylase n=1 Tax=Nocardia goodfellowii TaxID=882446 RepID=A0ABS4QBN3_9NOCA|nr:hypothetical protein [Nocardia goodfellowii]MBP2189109.1 diaminopimelate decarboxylase [Nocardia goodfellowii]
MGLDSTAELTIGLFDTDNLALFDVESDAPAKADHDPRIPGPAPDGPADPDPRSPDPDPRDPSPPDQNPRIPDPPDPHVPNPEPDPRVATEPTTADSKPVDAHPGPGGARPGRKKSKSRKRTPSTTTEAGTPETVADELTVTDTQRCAATALESIESGSGTAEALAAGNPAACEVEATIAELASTTADDTEAATHTPGDDSEAELVDVAPADDPLNEFRSSEVDLIADAGFPEEIYGELDARPSAVAAAESTELVDAPADDPLDEFSTGGTTPELAAEADFPEMFSDELAVIDARSEEVTASESIELGSGTSETVESATLDSTGVQNEATPTESATGTTVVGTDTTTTESLGTTTNAPTAAVFGGSADDPLNEFRSGEVTHDLATDTDIENEGEPCIDDITPAELEMDGTAGESVSQTLIPSDVDADPAVQHSTMPDDIAAAVRNSVEEDPIDADHSEGEGEVEAQAGDRTPADAEAQVGGPSESPVNAETQFASHPGTALDTKTPDNTEDAAPVDTDTNLASETKGGDDAPVDAETQVTGAQKNSIVTNTHVTADSKSPLDTDTQATADTKTSVDTSTQGDSPLAGPFLDDIRRTGAVKDVAPQKSVPEPAVDPLRREAAAAQPVSSMRASAEPPAQRARWDRKPRPDLDKTEAPAVPFADASSEVACSDEATDTEPSASIDSEATASETISVDTVALPLPAHRDEWEQRVLDDQHLLEDIAFAVGGPFHLMYPQRVARNIQGFRDVFVDAGVDGAIYYGKKANKAGCVARACAENGTGVDVSSVGELTAALAQGVRGNELMVTGPAKSDDLLWLAVRHGALIALDALDELRRLERIASAATPARVLLRVLPAGSASRFGLSDSEIGAAMSVIGAAGPAGLEPIQLEGFSFHLSGYDAAARAGQAEELIDHCLAARKLGHPVTTISIGGGFGVDYVPEQAWTEFTAGVNSEWFHAGKNFDSFYPYHFPAPGPAMLSAVLEQRRLGERLRDNDIRLAIEPGRALLDNAGSTVFRVQGGKTRFAHGRPYQVLTVDGTSLSLSEQWFDSEFLPDPVLWPHRPGTPTPAAVGAATCLESDMLSWRRIPLPRHAEVGDLLIYPNTAGYQMDSNESAFHDLPIPPKIVLHDAPGERVRWTFDS